MGFTGSGSADEDQVGTLLYEAALVQRTYLVLVYRGFFKNKAVQILNHRELCLTHPIPDTAQMAFGSLCFQIAAPLFESESSAVAES